MPEIEVWAPAKINLALHVTGQRPDGYHLLDSLVTFAHIGDRLTVSTDQKPGLSVIGPMAQDVPLNSDNSVLRVAHTFWSGAGLAIKLEKNLPVASGIGGGSADAAACYRAIEWLNARPYLNLETGQTNRATTRRLLAIGADVPMCVHSHPVRVQGIGEKLDFISGLPPLWAVLVNPGVPVSTPAVFKALTQRKNTAMSDLVSSPTTAQFLDWLAAQRNDLEAPAIATVPEIAHTLAALKDCDGCKLVRMSGSGATCFGLFETLQKALEAAGVLGTAHPNWWVQATEINGDTRSAPQLIRSTT